MRSSRYLLPVSGAVVTGAWGVAAYITRRINGARPARPGMDRFTFSPWELEVPHETVEFQSDDGVMLRGWWFPRAGSDTVIIGCPGHRRGKHDLLGIGSGLWRSGNNILLFDFRGCWDSDPAPQSLGYKEVSDLRAAIGFSTRKVDGARIGIIGYSMGAAVAILAAAEDTNVLAVVADSSFAAMRDVIAHQFRRRGFPTHPALSITDHYNRLRYGYPFHAVRPVDAVGRISPRPLLLIHGTRDETIPIIHSYRLFEAAGEPKEFWIDQNASHCGTYFEDRSEYVKRVSAFFANALTRDRGRASA